MKLNLGNGGTMLDGYVNIDYADVKCDRKFDLQQPLDYEDNSIEQIVGFHVFEHLPIQCIEKVVTSWYRVLQPGGTLILEMPDFDEVLKWVMESPNDNSRLASIFGNQERAGQFHHWGWNKTRLKFLFEGVGFKDVIFPEPQDYHAKIEPCLRVEATK